MITMKIGYRKSPMHEWIYQVKDDEPLGTGANATTYKCRRWSEFDSANVEYYKARAKSEGRSNDEHLEELALQEYIRCELHDNDFDLVVKVYNPTVDLSDDATSKEGRISHDVRLAISPPFLSQFSDIDEETEEKVITKKRCLVLHRLNENLERIISDDRQKTDAQQATRELDQAIELSIHVSNLHNGLLSRSETKYAHGDINPQNILQDKNGHLKLIDYGSAGEPSELIGNINVNYAPIDISFLKQEVQKTQTNLQFMDNLLMRGITDTMQKTNSAPISLNAADRIALLRTIRHPLDNDEVNIHHYTIPVVSILSKNTYEHLPQALKDFINTTEVAPHIVEKEYDTTKLIAAVLILYRNQGDINEIDIQRLRGVNGEAEQNQLIEAEQMRLQQRSVSPSLSPDGSILGDSALIDPSSYSSSMRHDSAARTSADPDLLSDGNNDDSFSDDNGDSLMGSPPSDPSIKLQNDFKKRLQGLTAKGTTTKKEEEGVQQNLGHP